MPSPVKSSLREILPKVRDRLVSATGISANRVLYVQRPDTPHFQGDQDILIRVGPPRPLEHVHGSGRLYRVVSRLLQITPRTRWAVDESDRDDSWLLAATEGHLRLEEAVVDAIDVWVPERAGGDWLLIEPMRWVESQQPVRETPLSQSWGHTDLVFEFKYQFPATDNTF